MRDKQASVETQLRLYADAIDPNRNAHGVPGKRRWGPSITPTWIVAAAAVLFLVGIAVVAARPSDVQQVETGEFAAQESEELPGEAPALPPGVPATGDWRTRQESLVVGMANSVLAQECMRSRDFDYRPATNDELVELHGRWEPNGVLGIGTEGAARRIGYGDGGWGGGGSPTQSAATNAQTPEEQEAQYEALLGVSAAGEPTARNGCWSVVESMLGDYQNKEVAYDRELQFGSDGTQGERFRVDPVLAAGIEAWQVCISDSMGIDADTPNTLARQFVGSGQALSAREREVAVADVRCQQSTDLEQIFAESRTRQVRAELGDRVEIFDDYARFRVEVLRLSQQVLDERGIVPPSLD